MANYLGRNPAIGTQKLLDSIASQFNGALVTFDLRYSGTPTYPTLSAGLLVSLGGVLQEPSEAYYVSSDKIVFSAAPQAGTECWILLYSEFGSAQSGAGEAAIAATGEPMGFENRTHSTVSFASNTRTFSIGPNSAAGHSSYVVWTKGTRRTYSVAQSVQIGTTTGLYYIYFDGGGALQSKTTYFTWDTETPVAYVYWNATTSSAPFVADERHGIVLDWATHEYLHRTRGAVIAEGFSISAYTTAGDGSADAHAQFDLGNGTFFDEDLEVAISHSATPTVGTFTQVLTGAAEIPVFYLSGSSGAWVRDAPTEYACKQSGTTLQYNLLTGSTWSTTPATNNRYVVSWIVATNEINAPIIAILGQDQYTAIGSAEAVKFGDLVLTNFPIVEFRPLWKVIFQTSTSFTNTPNALVANVLDLRQLSETGEAGTVVSDHGLLSGLADDDHAQYLHTTLDRTSVTSSISTTGAISAASLSTGASGVGVNINNAGLISGPATITLDPAAVGDDTGLVRIKGGLEVLGTTTTISSTTLTVADKNIVIGQGGSTLSSIDEAGIDFGSTAVRVRYNYNAGVASGLSIEGGNVGIGTTSPSTALQVVGTVTATAFAGALTGTASNVTTNANLTGDVTSVGNATAIAAGVIVNDDINASAAIVDTKLNTIATAGKVSNSATTATSALGINTIVARDGSNNFTAGTITAALTGAASSNVLKAGDTMTGALVVPLGAVGTPSLTFTGDLNTGVFSPGADQLAVATNGVERVKFGTAEVVFNDTGVNYDFRIEGDTNTNLFFVDASTDCVGIGTSSPNTPLSVRAVSTITTYGNVSAQFSDNVTGTFYISHSSGVQGLISDGTLAFGSGASGAERARIRADGMFEVKGGGVAGTSPALSVSGSAPANSLVLDSSGRVGLGTSSPSALLHCFSPDSVNTTAYFRLTNSSAGSGLYRNLHIDGTHPNGASSWKGIDITPAQATIAPMTGIDMSWNQTYSEGRGVNINFSKNTHAGGGAGIGVFSRVIATGTNDLSHEAIGGWFVTDKGAGALDPYTSYTLKVENRSTVNNTNLTAFYTDSSTIRGSIYYDRTNNALALSGSNAFRIDTNGSSRLFVNSSGDVGIGNVSPPYKLTIDKQGTADWGAGLKRILSVDNNWVYSTFRTPYTVTTTTHPAGWYNIVKILSWDFNVDIHISFSGDFTADQIDIEAKSSWNAGLNNNNAGPHLRVNRTMAHNGNRLQQVRIGYDSIGNTYIQAYLNLTFGAAGAVKVAVVDKCSAWADTIVKAEPMLTTATSITVLNTVNLANTTGEYYNLNGGACDFVWGTNATERLRITSTGTVNIVGAGTAGSTQAISFNGTAPVNSLVLDSNGRVGLGTSGPVSGNVAILNIRQIGGNLSTTTVTRANAQGVIIADSPSTSNSVGNGIWFDSGSLIAGIASTRANTGNWGTDLRFYTHPTTTTNQDETYERLRIDPAGNVGIGTASPGELLHVGNGSAQSPKIKIQSINSSGQGNPALQIERNGEVVLLLEGVPNVEGRISAVVADVGFLTFRTGTNTEKMRLHASGMFEVKGGGVAGTSPAFSVNGSAPANSLVLDSNGLVGIGNPSPAEKLEVTGKFRLFDGGYPYIDIGISTSNYFRFIHDNPNDRFYIGKNNNATLVITGANNVEPGADATQNFGSATKRWANVYSADLQLSNEGSATGNEIDGTWGAYTIQEGEEALYLINRRSGKKFKFILEEVE